MTYSSTNPPALETQSIAGPRTWAYTSSDPAATVDTIGYFSDGYSRGMRAGDVVRVRDTVNSLITAHNVISAISTAVDLGTGTTVGSSANAD